jgi:hypothetical protein
LHVAGGIGQVVDSPDHPERHGAFDEHVHAAVFEALEHLADAGGAADLLEPVVGEPDDSELALLLEALADHELVALLEDVQRNQLMRDQDEPERKQGKALLDGRHPT